VQQFYRATVQKLVMSPMRLAHVLHSHSRQNKDNCFR